MKTVYMTRDFYYQPHRKFSVLFKAHTHYRQVIDKAAAAIERSGAGSVVPDDTRGVDASAAWKPRRGGGSRVVRVSHGRGRG